MLTGRQAEGRSAATRKTGTAAPGAIRTMISAQFAKAALLTFAVFIENRTQGKAENVPGTIRVVAYSVDTVCHPTFAVGKFLQCFRRLATYHILTIKSTVDTISSKLATAAQCRYRWIQCTAGKPSRKQATLDPEDDRFGYEFAFIFSTQNFERITMQYRQLGNHGPRVSAIGLGMWPLVGGLGRIEEKDAIATIRYALDSGITLVDAAQSYENSEELLGKALKDGYRDQCFIATKVSWRYSRADVASAIESSLRKLGVDHVDLYQVHGWWDHKYPIEETMEAMAAVRDQGKARHIGVSNFNAEQIQRALAITPFQSNQILYNMFSRQVEAADIPFCERHGIGVIAHTAMAHGFLSGRFRPGQKFAKDDYRSRLDRFKGDTFAQCLQIATKLESVANDKGISLVQLALAWILRKDAVSCLLAGAKRPSQIDEQLNAPNTKFSDEELERIDAILEDTPDLTASAKPSFAQSIVAFLRKFR